ncbi:MAG: YbhB/YbcL family Raf kinase inhibitor-like protein [Candidatus Babeliales bacterium]
MKIYLLIIALLSASAGYFFLIKPQGGQSMLKLASNSFVDKGEIPQQYTCQGENISPELHWDSDIEHVGSYVLIVDDPDAQKVVGKTFVHWIAYVPERVNELPEGASGKGIAFTGFNVELHEEPNDSGKTVYYGPCPPAGSGVHTYRFTLYAVKETVDQLIEQSKFEAPFTAEVFAKNMVGSLLGQARITGSYESK